MDNPYRQCLKQYDSKNMVKNKTIMAIQEKNCFPFLTNKGIGGWDPSFNDPADSSVGHIGLATFNHQPQ